MKLKILLIVLFGISIGSKAQTLIANPQNSDKEGGEIQLKNSKQDYNDWRIDNYAGNLRFHHSGKRFLNVNNVGDFLIKGKLESSNLKLKATTSIEGGEIALDGSTNYNDWRIDNYAGNLRFHHSGKSYFNLNSNGNASLKGKLEVKELKVTNTPTADFVFEENYNLPTLKSIDEHIKKKKHLPQIASAKEMEKNGVNVGEFQIQLLQKIEELTLYTIQQEKEIEQLKLLNQKVTELQTSFEKFKSKN